MLTVGDNAFATRSLLGSVLSHEVETHWNQIQRNHGYGPNDELQRYRWQATAYRRQIENADRFGNSASEVQEFKQQYDAYKGYGEDPEDAKK